MTTPENCDAKTLAVIAAQFIGRGVDEEEALQKANALYLKAKEFEAFSEEAMRALADSEEDDLAIGDSKANSPAFDYFHATAKTKLDKAITYKKFRQLIERFYDRRPEDQKTKLVDGRLVEVPWTPPGGKINRGILNDLLEHLRLERSQKRSARRKKSV